MGLWKEYLSITARALGHTRCPGAPVHFVHKQGAASFKEGGSTTRECGGVAINSARNTGVACRNWQGHEKIISPHLTEEEKKKHAGLALRKDSQQGGRGPSHASFLAQTPMHLVRAHCQLARGVAWRAHKGKDNTEGS